MSADQPTVDFHFDPLCPFAYQTSRWIREVRDQVGITVNWRFFSLEEVNHVDGTKHPWERPWSYGWSMMRIGVLLRRRSMAQLDSWYEAVGRALHVEGQKPHRPEVARELLEQIGMDPGLLERALDDETTHDEITADHQRVLDAGGYGVPTLFLSGAGEGDREDCLFGPVLINPPTGPEALRLWALVVGWHDFPQLYELQRLKSPVDQRAIVESLAPYLAGRDWVSVDRGRVIELPDPGPEDRSEGRVGLSSP